MVTFILCFRGEGERTIQEVYNSIPFALHCGDLNIEVADALSAHYLDLETVSDIFEPSSGSIMDYLWGKSPLFQLSHLSTLCYFKSNLIVFWFRLLHWCKVTGAAED